MQNTVFNNRIDCNTLNAGFPSLPSILLTDGWAADDSGVWERDQSVRHGRGLRCWKVSVPKWTHCLPHQIKDCSIAMCWNVFFLFILYILLSIVIFEEGYVTFADHLCVIFISNICSVCSYLVHPSNTLATEACHSDYSLLLLFRKCQI